MSEGNTSTLIADERIDFDPEKLGCWTLPSLEIVASDEGAAVHEEKKRSDFEAPEAYLQNVG